MARRRKPPKQIEASDQRNRNDICVLLNDVALRVVQGQTHGVLVIELQGNGFCAATHSEMSPAALDQLETALNFARSIVEQTNDMQGYSN